MMEDRRHSLSRLFAMAFAGALLLGLAVAPAPDHPPAAQAALAHNAG